MNSAGTGATALGMGERQDHRAERHYWGQEIHVVHPLLSSVSSRSHKHMFTRPGELGLTQACGKSRIKPWDSLWDGLTCASCTWWRWCQDLAVSLPWRWSLWAQGVPGAGLSGSLGPAVETKTSCLAEVRTERDIKKFWPISYSKTQENSILGDILSIPFWGLSIHPCPKSPLAFLSIFSPTHMSSDDFHTIWGVIATVTHMPVAQRFLFTWGHLKSNTCLLESFAPALTQLPQREDFSATLWQTFYVPGLSRSNKSRSWWGNFLHQAPWVHPCWNNSDALSYRHRAHFLAQSTLAQVPWAEACLDWRAKPRSHWPQQWLFWSCDICFPPTLKAWESTALFRKPAGWSMYCW